MPDHQAPHRSVRVFVRAITATALFRIWPTLIFMGGWSLMVVMVNRNTDVEFTFPATMVTVLGVLLGLTLSYRTSSAYDRYWEGRRLWSQIILASRSWARIVWIHCPDSLSAVPIDDVDGKALDETRAVMEKATMVHMALAFAVAVKHYLRGEEGIFYEDLYHLVRFIPSLNLPSGIPSGIEANIGSDPARRQVHKQGSASSSHIFDYPLSDRSTSPSVHKPDDGCPPLDPAHNPPKFRWADVFPVKFFLSRRHRQRAAQRRQDLKSRARAVASREGGGVGHNVPLEISMFMSVWVAQMQRRKTIDVPTINSLLAPIQQMAEALVGLERILTTPIPWSYNAHIWEVTWVYCLLLPFQLYGAGFKWLTIPGTIIVAYIVIGFAEIGEEIENPFGYDPNDLALDTFTQNIIARELAAIVARPFAPPETWIFSAENKGFGPTGAGDMQYQGVSEVRRCLARSLVNGGVSEGPAVSRGSGEETV
ncbi:Bestrophin, RFP-TM, chloride channel-domain-containing protein [Dioszegia hungarica]|uniref:Bestrophin, RFP-TM, chloride channel-domain-containing protein n=1 Tax=Dioszegia hungarica TaxID=4972 RepID=A0AA38H4Q1_9TREE|nr:Bestrophin, RFP-TM, chloride channel-domain-containing protein [Dioszegia hungarica]KAI9633770.1 Bestrophin, RFP-TM, chloride channel-domain-containing protein [Dioszegia hungarica]